MAPSIKAGDKVFLINPKGLYNKPHWIETVIIKLDDNGEDFFTTSSVTFVLPTGCGGEFDASDNCFPLDAEGKTWWRADTLLPPVDEASSLALAWYNE